MISQVNTDSKTSLLHKTIETFGAFFDNLAPYNDNLVISGSTAMREHGLILGREPSDVDFALYMPTQPQIKFLKSIEVLNLIKVQEKDEDDYDKWRMKFKKDGLTIDILIEENEFVPDGLLEKFIHGRRFKVQSIAGVMEAKISYIRSDKTAKYLGYGRVKDFNDFLVLKNLNFNIPADVIEKIIKGINDEPLPF